MTELPAPLKITLLLTLQRSLSHRACRGLGRRNMWPSKGDRRGSAEAHFNNRCHRICSAQSLSGGGGRALGGCRLLVARGDWRYGVWGDVTCSSTRSRPTHTQTHAHTQFLFWLVRVIHLAEHLSLRRRRAAVTGSLQMPTGGWECPHTYRRQTRPACRCPGAACLMAFSVTYIPFLKFVL